MVTENKGYYSIIQYIPDIGRLEAVNVGILLIIPETQSLALSTGHSNYTRLLNFFPNTNITILNFALSNLTYRISKKTPTKAKIKLLVDSLANELRMTPLRSVKVTQKPSEALKKLRAELVDI